MQPDLSNPWHQATHRGKSARQHSQAANRSLHQQHHVQQTNPQTKPSPECRRFPRSSSASWSAVRFAPCPCAVLAFVHPLHPPAGAQHFPSAQTSPDSRHHQQSRERRPKATALLATHQSSEDTPPVTAYPVSAVPVDDWPPPYGHQRGKPNFSQSASPLWFYHTTSHRAQEQLPYRRVSRTTIHPQF